MVFVTQTEQIVAVLLMAFLVADTIVRIDMVYQSLKTGLPIQRYFKGWLNEKKFKEWYMYLSWDRVVLVALTGAGLIILGFYLVMFILGIKVFLDFVFHLMLRMYARYFF